MKRLEYVYGATFLLFISCVHIYAQVPNRKFEKNAYNSIRYSKYGNNKKIPNEVKPQVLLALSFYPELSNTKIIFRYRKRKTPLSSRPQIWSTFKKRKNRTYVISISTKSTLKLTPILFSNLPYNAQIGVLGHELAHITEYNSKNSWQLLGLYLKLLKAENVDEFEFNTDLTCIEHGLGYQLHDWSQYVRQALHIPEWRGASKANYNKKSKLQNLRYMNPSTIKSTMSNYSIYEK